ADSKGNSESGKARSQRREAGTERHGEAQRPPDQERTGSVEPPGKPHQPEHLQGQTQLVSTPNPQRESRSRAAGPLAACFLCAEHVRQLGGESPLLNLPATLFGACSDSSTLAFAAT